MLSMYDIDEKRKMMNYYRTSDMLNLLYFFPNLSPIKDMTILEDMDEYLCNKEFFDSFEQSRADSIKGRGLITGVECIHNYSEELKKIKEKDPLGVLLLFNTINKPSQRYERYAGISVGVDLGEDVYIDAVSKGFDGREVSKSICTHERYYIPWFDLRGLCIENFKNYQTYQISEEEYQKTRLERIKYLTKNGLDPNAFSKYIPEKYERIPDFIWLSVIRNLLKELEKQEDFLEKYNFYNFAISGHTEGNEFAPWQLFDKDRYLLTRKK